MTTATLNSRLRAASTTNAKKRVDHSKINQAKYIGQTFRTGASLAVVDVACVAVSLFTSIAACSLLGWNVASHAPSLVAFAVAIVGAYKLAGLYKAGLHPAYEVRQILKSVGLVGGAAALHFAAIGVGATQIAIFAVVLATVAPIVRAFARGFLVKRSWWGVKCVVFGADRRVQTLYGQHMKDAVRGLKPVGFVQDGCPKLCAEDVAEQFLGRVSRTKAIVAQQPVSCALVHRRGRTDSQIQDFIDAKLNGFARIIILQDDVRLPSLWSMGGSAGVSIEDNLLRPSWQLVKRAADIAISLTMLTLGLPVFAGLAAWIKVTAPGPLFFGHTRIGKDGRRFKAWKFRSMVVDAEAVLQKHLSDSPELQAEWDATQKLQNDPRVTSSGRFLRKSSLDELPQLWNVLVGEMSLVGPRPIVENEVEKYADTFKSYLRVTPGITGLWQVSGRNLTTYERRVELDEFYVRNWSCWFDLYILARTAKTVLLREGAF